MIPVNPQSHQGDWISFHSQRPVERNMFNGLRNSAQIIRIQATIFRIILFIEYSLGWLGEVDGDGRRAAIQVAYLIAPLPNLQIHESVLPKTNTKNSTQSKWVFVLKRKCHVIQLLQIERLPFFGNQFFFPFLLQTKTLWKFRSVGRKLHETL